MNIQKYIEEAHANAVEKGFYDCPECGGVGESFSPNHLGACISCNGTGIDPNKNIGELLMLIVSELGEALEAHRCGRFAKMEIVESNTFGEWDCIPDFEKYIKDTFEDEIADVFIRLFDLCGYLGIELSEPGSVVVYKDNKNVGETFLYICGLLSDARIERNSNFYEQAVFELLLGFCQHNNIHIQKHIEAKMAYNKTRPEKHGKAY